MNCSHSPTDVSEASNDPDSSAWDADARFLAELAGRYVRDINAAAAIAPKFTSAKQVLRVLYRFRRFLRRKTRELIQDHWDVGVLNVVFGSLKAFVIYPYLYFAGLTWTIPICEYLPLNTELWTGGYLFCRRYLLSAIGRGRYGHSLNKMNEYRDRTLAILPRDARSVHRFETDGFVGTVRIRRNRIRDWIRRLRRLPRETNVVLQAELRKMVSDKEFLFRAGELRNNAYLYEAVLLRKVLGSPEGRDVLLTRVSPEPPPEAHARELRDLIGESLEPSFARVIEQGNSLTDTLKVNLGHKFSAASMALRWINWSYQRRTYRVLAELNDLHYRLLFDVLNGVTIADSVFAERIRETKREVKLSIDRAAHFGTAAKAALTSLDTHRVIVRGIRSAQEFGLSVRLARLAFRLSPSMRRVERRCCWSREKDLMLSLETAQLFVTCSRSGLPLGPR